MSNIEIEVESVTTIKQKQILLDRDKILTLLKDQGLVIPPEADVVFHVPGGGDWSNTDVEVASDCPVIVRWVEKGTSK